MCAIIGALGNIPSKEIFVTARNTMIHRGPDDAGLFYEEQSSIALGHRRLSIIDLSDAGRQPMESSHGKYIIVFNGEIYNFKGLRGELKDTYTFKTQTDSETILAAYEKWGIDAAHHLQGMFSFALWDKEKETLFVVRDRLGIKPLYYSFKNGTFYFSSEIKGILAMTKEQSPKLNKQGFLDYLSYRYALGGSTLFEGIYSLLPGHYILIKKGKAPEQKQYWELPIERRAGSEEEVLAYTEKLLKDTIRAHMVSDVPIGAYLSGGLDSSLIVALMAEQSDKPIKTFSAGFAGDEDSELGYARLVSKKYKTDHKEIILDDNDYLDLLSEVIAYKDTPLGIPNEVALFALSKELKKDISVVVSGEGADELFGGYGRIFRSGDDFEKIQNKTYTQDELLQKNLQDKYGQLEFESIEDFFLSQYSYFDINLKQKLLNRKVFTQEESKFLHIDIFKKYFSYIKQLRPAEQFMYIFEKVHLLEPMQRLDNATMAKSVEARVPFIDHKLVEYVSTLPLEFKMRWKSDSDKEQGEKLNSDQVSENHDITKYLLRKISEKYLPKEILERKKLGFPVPLHNWAKGRLLEQAKASLLSKDAKSYQLYDRNELEKFLSKEGDDKQYAINVWMLLNVELWMKAYNITL